MLRVWVLQLNIFVYGLGSFSARELEIVMGLMLRRPKNQVRGADAALLATMAMVFDGV